MTTSFFVYILESDISHSTYVGATVDLNHRLRQHNKELVGGAQATSIKVGKGEKWKRLCHITGFPDWKAALQFEWKLKFLSRKLPIKMFPLERRMMALKQLLLLERPTSKSISFKEWTESPKIVFECDVAEKSYNTDSV